MFMENVLLSCTIGYMQEEEKKIVDHKHAEHITDHKKETKEQSKDKKNGIYTILLFILAPLFALFMIIFVFQSYIVDGTSMTPTLQNGDRVFILKLPKSFDGMIGKTYIPSRHEIIVFKKPSDPSTQLIKRVIGLPGDTVVVNNGKITVYNAQNPNGFNPDANTDYGPTLASTIGNVDITVGANELFVCGDNRGPGGSLDSRTGVGLVPVQNIIGRLWVRYYPFSSFKTYSTELNNLLKIKNLKNISY